MEEVLNTPKSSPLERWLQPIRALPARARLALMIGIPAVLAMLIGLVLWANQPDYKVLFSGLTDKDGGAVIAALTQMQTPHKISNGGSSILVPADQVHEVRLKLAQQGLPKGSVAGFEAIDQQKYGLTQFQEQINYQRAMEGELARSIMSMSAVESARVHLAVPKQTVFVREALKPTASVVLTLRSKQALDRSQLDGIVHLVASSVPELTPKNVSVVDQSGSLLTSSTQAQANGLDDQQLAYVHQLETNYTHRVVDILSPLVGAENVKAQVTLDIDFSQVEQTSESYKPNQGKDQAAIRSQQSTDQQSNQGAGAAGIPGSLTNQPPGGGSAPINATAPGQPQTNQTANQSAQGASSSGQSRRDATINYELDKTISHAKLPTGSIRRLSAAIVVNYRSPEPEASAAKEGAKAKDTKPAKGKGPERNPGPEALSEEELQKISALAKEALGFSDKRGDSINVVNAPFTRAAPAAELPLWQDPVVQSVAGQSGKWLAILLIAALLVFGVVRPLLKQLTPVPVENVTVDAQGNPVVIGPDGVPVAASGENGDLPEEQSPAQLRRAEVDRLRTIILKDPKMVANILRNWMNADG